METKLGKSKVLFKKMFIKKIKNFSKYLILFLFVILTNNTRAEFFEDLSKIIENNKKRLSYGISVTDFNMDGNYEFLVTGFGFANLALSYQDEKLKDLNQQKIFSDASKKTIKGHTATHLLNAALIKVLGSHVSQKGSNITPERLRFDFSHHEKLSDDQIKSVENLVNEQIKKNIPVTMEEMSVEKAKKIGAIGVFEQKYHNKVKVYSIGNFSKEI